MIRANYRSITPKGAERLDPYPIRLSESNLNDIDFIRRTLMKETKPPSSCSRAIAVRRAIEFYATHLRRIGDEKLAIEIRRATRETTYVLSVIAGNV